MREISEDAWKVKCDVLCITTNCTIKSGRAVMGGGIAGSAARKFPHLPSDYARLIEAHGHHVFLMRGVNREKLGYHRHLLMFPTKQEVWQDSDLDTIGTSFYEAAALADIYGWETIAVPRPGAGLGGLDWHKQVKPFLEADVNFDDRFLIVSYPGEK